MSRSSAKVEEFPKSKRKIITFALAGGSANYHIYEPLPGQDALWPAFQKKYYLPRAAVTGEPRKTLRLQILDD